MSITSYDGARVIVITDPNEMFGDKKHVRRVNVDIGVFDGSSTSNIIDEPSARNVFRIIARPFLHQSPDVCVRNRLVGSRFTRAHGIVRTAR